MAQKQFKAFNLGIESIKIVDPMNYLSFLQLERNAKLVLTDSGGVQEESSKSWMEQYPFFDGVMVDNGLKYSESEWEGDVSARPINPRTGTYFTWDEIKTGYVQLLSEGIFYRFYSTYWYRERMVKVT